MYTLLHLSDLHRPPNEPISNDELLSALVADLDAWQAETPPIPAPDAIVISGDLVQGVKLEAVEYPDALEAQYRTATAFLGSLANRFLDGDRSRLIIVPGNHDVDWNAARASMDDVDAVPPNLRAQLAVSDSPLRWDWEHQKVYRVRSRPEYEQRLALYCKAVNSFYASVPMAFDIDPTRYYNLYELDQGRIVVAAFNSCYANDCFSGIGLIPPESIAQCHLEMRDSGSLYPLKIAVWHHSIGGGPLQDDYMDPATVSHLIARGFRLGLHGHQHRSDATPFRLQVYGEERMAVVSAGSLCAGRQELPTGSYRQFNVVVLHDSDPEATVYVREMLQPGTFGPGRLSTLGGRSKVDVSWTREPTPMPIVPEEVSAHTILRAEQAVASGDFALAKELLLPLASALPPHGRTVLNRALVTLSAWTELKTVAINPVNVDGLVALLKAHVGLGEYEAAQATLDSEGQRLGLAEPTRRDLTAWLNAERRLKK